MAGSDERMRELRRELRGLRRHERRRVLDEVRDHLLSAREDGIAEADAVARLGDPGVAFAGFPRRRRTHRATLIAVPIAFLAFAAPVSTTLEKLGAGPAPSQAATNPLLDQRRATSRCVAAWNGAASRQWRAVARASGAQIAHVGVFYMGRLDPRHPKRMLISARGCTVSLKLGRVPSPEQPYLDVYASYAGGTFAFDHMLRGHVRTAASAANARVTSDGRLALTTRTLHQSCPPGPIGTGIQSVFAVGQKRRLTLAGTTQLSASAQPLAVAVRNGGRLAIRGAIASLEVYGPARPDRPWWRSKPVTIPRLAPGATVVVRFAPPALGHGARLIRATTAAIECETRFSDNSPVFRVHAS